MPNKTSPSGEFENDDFLFDNVWRQRLNGLALDEVNIFRDITDSDIAYIKKRAPFLQLMNPKAEFGESVTLRFVEANSGWTIFDYGDAISASPGSHLFSGYPPIKLSTEKAAEQEKAEENEEYQEEQNDEETNSNEDESEGYTTVGEEEEEDTDIGETEFEPTGKGTIVKQAFDTATEMVQIVGERWPSMQIIAGERVMQWAAWVAAQEHGYKLEGFEPTLKEKEQYERLRKQRQQRTKTATPKGPAP